MIKLPRLPYGWDTNPRLFERYWDEVMRNIEKLFNDLLTLPIIEDSLAQLAEATQNANDAASSALAAGNEAQAQTSLINSFVDADSYVGDLISCDVSGTITLQTHDRVYGDGSSVSVSGDVFTVAGVSAGNVIRVYYIDSARSGGAVSYLTVVDPTPVPAQTGDTHSVGAVIVPAIGASIGEIVRQPGYVYV